MSDCLGKRMAGYRSVVSKKSDKVLLLNAENKCDDGIGTWYNDRSPALRAYMRLVKQEIHRRGLS